MNFMHADDRIHVVGESTLVGAAIVRRLRASGHGNLVSACGLAPDFTQPAAVDAFYARERPAHVFIAGASLLPLRSAGERPAAQLRSGLLMATNLIHAAWRRGVRRLLFLGEAVVDVGEVGWPLEGDVPGSGHAEDGERYERAGAAAAITLCSAYNREYGTDFLAVVPAVVYGPGDSTDPARSSGVAALVHKAHCALVAGEDVLRVTGQRIPQGEFIYCDDLAAACVHLLGRCDRDDVGECVSVGSGKAASAEETVRTVARVIGFRGDVVVEPAVEPSGGPEGGAAAPRVATSANSGLVGHMVLDSSRIRAQGWRPLVAFERGVELVYHDYLVRHVVGALL